MPCDEYIHTHTQANALGRAGQWGLLLNLMKEMSMAGHPPTEVAFNAAIEACAKVSRWALVFVLAVHCPFFCLILSLPQHCLYCMALMLMNFSLSTVVMQHFPLFRHMRSRRKDQWTCVM